MCLRGLLLVAGLVLSSWALTPEECEPLVTPRSLADPSMMYGRSNFLAGYNDNNVFRAILSETDSSLINISASPAGPQEAFMSQLNKMKRICIQSTVKTSFDGDTATVSHANITSTFHILPSSDKFLVMSLNATASNCKVMLKRMQIDSEDAEDEISLRALYLMGREATLSDSDLEDFKKQASCLGFSGEPHYIYKPENGFCTQEEAITVQF
ncbi:hypothetical protein PBY51_005618 [Eleginops maclovinus]|uniref:Uncharacterized protein n=1 Tax=Eleginops maclovinus TaxID=56733 RepID=A0AAN8AAJ6_ELEMC|nr:hypothetical protein PBY51_005618 [Eleginops maclovinus]